MSSSKVHSSYVIKHLATALGGSLAVIGAALRLHGYATSPIPNADEYDWAWSGLTLFQHHMPTGWTLFWEVYGRWTLLDWQGNKYAIVTPYVDHPPLFSLLMGGVAWLAGARQLTDINLATLRLVPIGLSLIALVLTYRLVGSIIGTLAALITLALLSISPAAIQLARLTESEALVTVLFLSALLALTRLECNPNDRLVTALLLLCCLAAPLAKLPGVAVGLAAVGVLLWRSAFTLAFLSAYCAALGVGIYVAYGSVLDADLFYRVWNAQEARHHGWEAGYELLRGGLADKWWALGIIGLGALASRGGSAARLLVWPAIAYVVVITLSANADLAGRYEWYRIPIYPLVYAGAGCLIALAGQNGYRTLRSSQRVG